MHRKNWILVFHFLDKHLKRSNSIKVGEEAKGSAAWYGKK